MKLEFFVETEAHQGLTFSIKQPGTYRLGRSTEADLALTEDKSISRQHCVVELTSTGALLRDVGSRAGTFVNAKLVQEAPLADGDKILIGQTTLRVSLSGAPPPQGAIKRPSRVPGFTVVKKVSTDGPGEVWWAVAEAANRLVILHFLPLDEPATTEDQQRFMRQAAICAKLRYPGLVRFLMQGITPEMLWFATELTDGQNLRQIVAAHGPLSLKDALEVLRQTLDIVAYLHQQDVVHRSLRPESLLIKKEADPFIVQLTDLGSAKCLQTAELQRITKLGKRSISIHPFTAPEALTEFTKIDSRSDIYALGAILYFALTGRAPYNLSAEADLAWAILEKDPPPLLTLKPDLPLALVNVVERAMAREIEVRYNTVQEMHAALFQKVLFPNQFNTAAIRQLLVEAFNDEEFAILCYDYFREVHQKFAVGMTFPAKVQLLINHCNHHNLFNQLLALVKEHNPNRYTDLEIFLKMDPEHQDG